MLTSTEAEPEEISSRPKHALRRITLIAVALLILGALAWPKLKPKAATGPAGSAAARPAATAVPVTVVEVRPRRLTENLSTTGTLRANEWVEVTSEIAGKAQAILFEEARRVEAGAVLVKIDDAELSAERERARMRLALATQREAQQRQLLTEGIISQDAYDRELNQKNILETELRLIEIQLSKTEIRAPFAGVVGLRSVSLGAYLTPQTKIATLQDIDPIKIDFAVPERYAGELRVGQRFEFRVKGIERAFEGEVYAIEPTVDLETRSLLLRGRSPNTGGALLPGAFADISLPVREVAAALTVPAIAVVPELAGKKVFVVVDGKAEARPIETGLRTDTEVEVVSGLAGGERVIVTGVQLVRPGIEVEVQ